MKGPLMSVLVTLGIIAVGVSACVDDCGPFEPQVATITSGDYVGQEILDRLAQAFPHSGGDQFRLSVDRGNDIVEVRYVVQGVEVVERWRVVRSEVLGGP